MKERIPRKLKKKLKNLWVSALCDWYKDDPEHAYVSKYIIHAASFNELMSIPQRLRDEEEDVLLPAVVIESMIQEAEFFSKNTADR